MEPNWINTLNRSKKSLEKELIPIKAKWNEELLKEAGFKNVASYWKTYNFQAWIAIK